MASGFYDVFKQDLFEGNVDLNATDVINVALMDSSHPTANVDFWTNGTDWASVVANESSGTNYTTGGQALSGPQVATVNGTTTFDDDGSDTSWAAVTIADINHIVLYDVNNANSLIASVDIGPQSVTVGTFTIQWNALGIITMT